MPGWSLVYEGYAPAQEGLREALCAVGNGYFATRGAGPETSADGVHYPGTYLAGGYNRLVTRMADRDVENEDLVNLPNWLPLTLRVDDGPWFRIDDVAILEYRQALELKEGVLTRALRFRDGDGRTTRWRERRFASMADPHQAALAIEVTPEDWSGRLAVQSALDGAVTNDGVERYRDLEGRHLEILATRSISEDVIALHCRTNQSRVEVAQAARTRVYREGTSLRTERRTVERQNWIAQEIELDVTRGAPVVIEKVLALYTSRDQAVSEAGLAARDRVTDTGRFDDLLEAHRIAWKHLWDECDVDIDTDDPETLLKLRVHVFHLLQTVSPHSIDLDVGAPARGWHGEAYRGHVFWDELFVFPFLNLRLPVLTRALLRYRYRRLPAARRAAEAAGYAGAMYPWQSGSDGREESQKLHLNPRSGRWIPDHSHRQRHIDAAIAYNVWHYYQVTDDHEFLYFYGAEMLLETARFWASIASFNENIERYEIKGVMGPDEYHTAYPGADPGEHGGLDNNAYTNVMASWCLMRAQDALDLLPDDQCRALCERIGLSDEEIERWEHIGRRLRVPFHDDGIISQFEGYDALEEFDWEGYRDRYGDIQRLDRILEAEDDSPNRYKVSKQADVLMLFYLFSADELALLFERLGYPFARDTIPKNIDYYLRRTSHGSTLSFVAHAWVLARADRRGSWRHFQEALDSDITDIQERTTSEGIHLGAMAGTLDLLHRCYLGIETRANVLHFDPAMPREVDRLAVLLRYRRHKLEVEATPQTLTVGSRPVAAAPITIGYRGRFRELAPGSTFVFQLLTPDDKDRDENRRTPRRANRRRPAT